jgi:hypothetical protein
MTQPSHQQPGEPTTMTAATPAPGRDADEVTNEKLRDALTPGFAAEFDPDEAERAGAFAEDALSEKDALGSTDDLAEGGSMEPAFLDDDGPRNDLPPIFSTTNIRKLYDPRPGETLAQAAARKAKGG